MFDCNTCRTDIDDLSLNTEAQKKGLDKTWSQIVFISILF